VYSSHLFEHLTFEQGRALLDECLRVLKPGGSFWIVVPNARMYVEAYLGQRVLPEEYFAWEPAFNGTTAIDAVNYVAYMAGEHRYMFDQENLLYILRARGFANVAERAMDPEVDLPERDYESIYAAATKPS
jgi:predicted SAM-dependent methyltransferase